jgi:very-short-patch-repair endonuclease
MEVTTVDLIARRHSVREETGAQQISPTHLDGIHGEPTCHQIHHPLHDEDGRLLAEARAVTPTRSPLEDRFQRFCRFYDLPPHSTNVEVLGSEVDVLWPAAKLIVELDSWEFHSHRAAFQRDRARDTRLLVAGYRTIRVTHDRLDGEAGILASEIRELLRSQVVPSGSGPTRD